MDNTSFIQIDAAALRNNVRYLRNRLEADCTLSHVVKGNAYGHGVKLFVPLLLKEGAKHLSVFDSFEAYELRQCCSSSEAQIMIMGMVHEHHLEWCIEQEIEFFVFELRRLRLATEAAQKVGKPARVHIELETGMNRTGYPKSKWPAVAKHIKENRENLVVKGFCTHFAGAESIANHIRVRRQIKRFRNGVERFNSNGIKAPIHHTACSAAFMRFPQTHMNMVRIGIMQYGFWPSMETYIATEGSTENPRDPLRQVMSWKSLVMSVKKVNKGEYVGYGSSFLATQDMTVATVPVGYSHGFSRSLSNAGRALIRGLRVPVIGTVNMNMMMLDVCNLSNVETGDEVVLIGTQGDQTIDVASFGDYSNQLNYELLTRLPKDIPRYVVNA